MFTGIIADVGEVVQVEAEQGKTFVIATRLELSSVALGASIACAGVCLTVTHITGNQFTVFASEETLNKTTLNFYQPGDVINLEPALKLGDELGGHLVQGHVDGVGEIHHMEAVDQSQVIHFTAPKSLMRFIAEKGSVTIDGVSLTVNQVKGEQFTVNLIPHTLAHTTFQHAKPGRKVNLEIDVIARYTARLIETEAS